MTLLAYLCFAIAYAWATVYVRQNPPPGGGVA